MAEQSTRSKIVNTAVGMIRQKGYRNVSVTDICRQLGITRSAFYYYFKTKDEIFDYFLMEPELKISEEGVQDLENKDYLQQFQKIVRIFLDYIADLGPEILRIALKRHADRGVEKITPHHAAQWKNYVYLIQKAQLSGKIINTLKAEEIVETIIYAMNGISLLWVHENGAFCYQEECIKILQVIFEGLLNSEKAKSQQSAPFIGEAF